MESSASARTTASQKDSIGKQDKSQLRRTRVAIRDAKLHIANPSLVCMQSSEFFLTSKLMCEINAIQRSSRTG